MRIRWVRIREFRVHRSVELDFPETGMALVGRNGAGKSSILEALHCVLVGRSFRRVPDEQLVRRGSEMLEVVARLEWGGEDHTVEFRVVPGGGKRLCLDDRVVTRIGELVEQTRVVTTSSDDVLLVEGSPAYGRRWLDLFSCQMEIGHLGRLMKYRHVLQQRNVLLSRARGESGGLSEEELSPWTAQLFELAKEIERKRMSLVSKVDSRLQELYGMVAGEKRDVRVLYKPGLDLKADLGYVKRYARTERERGHTVWGPHRAVLEVMIDGVSARAYASRGEKRSLAFAMKLSQASLMDCAPLCLLDDMSLELDPVRSSSVLGLFVERGQVVASSTRMHDSWPEDLRIVHLDIRGEE